jgi:two-component sensor histidine kinase
MLIDDTALSPAATPIRDLVAEANHRIANSLSALAGLVQQQISSLRPDRQAIEAAEVKQMLAELRARVDAVARLHRALSDLPPGASIDAGKYLQQIASELIATLSPPDTTLLHFVCELGCQVVPDRALFLGLITVELVTNSLKYAHPAGVKGRIAIQCWRTDTEVVIQIADDGVGFPDGFDPKASRSGLRIVRSLVEQIGGKVRFESDDLGVTSTVQAPILVRSGREAHEPA